MVSRRFMKKGGLLRIQRTLHIQIVRQEKSWCHFSPRLPRTGVGRSFENFPRNVIGADFLCFYVKSWYLHDKAREYLQDLVSCDAAFWGQLATVAPDNSSSIWFEVCPLRRNKTQSNIERTAMQARENKQYSRGASLLFGNLFINTN